MPKAKSRGAATRARTRQQQSNSSQATRQSPRRPGVSPAATASIIPATTPVAQPPPSQPLIDTTGPVASLSINQLLDMIRNEVHQGAETRSQQNRINQPTLPSSSLLVPTPYQGEYNYVINMLYHHHSPEGCIHVRRVCTYSFTINSVPTVIGVHCN